MIKDNLRQLAFVRVLVVVGLLLILLVGAGPANASSAETLCFDLVALIGTGQAAWSSSGLVTSSGTATNEPFVSGWDPALETYGTIHDTIVLSDSFGSITLKVQSKSALVTSDDGASVPGYQMQWVITAGTGAYAGIHGQGDGYGWPDFASRTFPFHLCGQAHYEPPS